MNWNELTTLDQIDQVIEESKHTPVLIFKHSRSCSISKASLDRLERNWNLDKEAKTYFLDLLSYRNISNAIAERFGVQHESPQVLIIEQGESVYDKSHFDINYQDIKNKLQVAAG
ncbi:MAG: bacillithiol system redox-active protein YtxJ [Cyclobacteriaceae bacterium]